MAWIPKWAKWQADNPPAGIDPRVNRRFWYGVAWEVRFWLAWAALMVAFAIILLIAVLIGAF